MSDDKVFKPNDKELKLFEQEKMDLYKGTFVVCIVYGLSAIILLVLILFTDGGKEFIYDKFAPAVVTYILGSLIIILYLLNSIYTITARRIGNDMDSDNSIMCPDFWKLEKVVEEDKKILIANNNASGDPKTYIIPEITRDADKNIQYKCVYDKEVYGDTRKLLETKRGITGDSASIIAGFNNVANAITYAANPQASVLSPDYIVKLPKDIEEPNEKGLKSYAKFAGGYTTDNTSIFDSNNNISLRPAANEYLTPSTSLEEKKSIYTNYETKTPLICNQVYPQVLGILDSKTKEENEISCEYAKQCGISWSSLNCKAN
jgi:hypothetical protein